MSQQQTPAAPALAYGIDVGGTGIKGGIVDLSTGRLVGERQRTATPKPATPAAVAATVTEVLQVLQRRRIAPADAPVGIAVPAIVHHGVARSAANIDPGFIGTDLVELFTGRLGRAVSVLNDADAAGVCEAAFGAGRGVAGSVLLLTLGTGIGSALLFDGRLVPNFELGHLQFKGREAEHRASASARKREGLSWPEYAQRLNEFLEHVQFLFSPELIILGGGISKQPQDFMPLLELDTKVVPAEHANNAGIIGAALRGAAARPAAGR